MSNQTIDAAQIQESLFEEKKSSLLKETLYRLSRNRLAMIGAVILLLLCLVAIFADVIAPYGMDEQNYSAVFVTPCREHLFGTDNLGRDIFSRVVYGSRISLLIGICTALFSALLGTIVGAIAGYCGGRIEDLIMRLMDILLAIPSTLLAISVLATLGPGLFNTVLAVSISSLASYARIVRASILSVKEEDYVEAARALGASGYRIVLLHILPNCIAPIIVQVTLGVARAIMEVSSLSFIGLGIQLPIAEWGAMLCAARPYIRDHWHMVLFPGLAIMATVFGLNLAGDGLRDALDPRLKD